MNNNQTPKLGNAEYFLLEFCDTKTNTLLDDTFRDLVNAYLLHRDKVSAKRLLMAQVNSIDAQTII